MAAVAASPAFYFSPLNLRHCHHHHRHLTSLSPPLLYSICSASSVPSTRARLKAHTFELKNPLFPSSDESPHGVCSQYEEMEVGSASSLGILKEKMKRSVFVLDGNRLWHKGSSSILHSFVSGLEAKMGNFPLLMDARLAEITASLRVHEEVGSSSICILAISFVPITWLLSAQTALASESIRINAVYEIGEVFELGIQLTYLLLLLSLLGVGSFFVIRQVLVRRELDLSAKELQEQVRSGDASAMGLFELGAVMLRRKFYPAATKYLLQAIEKWDGDEQDLAQVYNALGVSYVLDGKVDKGILQFENAVKLQPGYVTAWNNLGDAYEKKKEITLALKAFEEALLFDPNNKVARPRRDALSEKVKMYRGVRMKSKKT